MRCGGALCALLMMLGAGAIEPALATEAPTLHAITLSDSRFSASDTGEVVIALQARGDIKGLLTLTVHQNADGGLGGEWSLVAAYFQDVDEHGQAIEPDPADQHDESAPHVERISYVNLGTIGGTIDGGALTLDSDGAIAGVDGVHLT